MRVIFDLPFSDYLKDPALSSHQAMEYLKSPLRYLHNKQHPKEPTNAMIIGRAVHTAILEPEKFEKEFIKQPAFSQRKADQEAKAAFLENCGSLQPIKAADWEMIEKITHSFRHSYPAQEIASFKKEVSLFFNVGGVDCKARIDALSVDGLVFVDLKTTEDPDPSKFRREFFYYNYDFQMAFYQMAIRAVMQLSITPTCYIYAIGKTEPVEVTRHVVCREVMEYGAGKVSKALEAHRKCLETQSWPTYDSKIAHEITL